jgi:hypothetical protein
MAIAAHVRGHDMNPGPVLELRVLKSLGGVQLAMRLTGVVENLGEHPHDVLVVVKDLVVVAAGPGMSLGEDGVRPVDNDFPKIMVRMYRGDHPSRTIARPQSRGVEHFEA